jgi:hypothetical protein
MNIEKRQIQGHCCNPPNTWTLTLNEYQRNNLLFLLNVCGYPYSNPHIIPEMNFDTGDWIGEIANALAKQTDMSGGWTPIIDDTDRHNGLPWRLQRRGKP